MVCCRRRAKISWIGATTANQIATKLGSALPSSQSGISMIATIQIGDLESWNSTGSATLVTCGGRLNRIRSAIVQPWLTTTFPASFGQSINSASLALADSPNEMDEYSLSLLAIGMVVDILPNVLLSSLGQEENPGSEHPLSNTVLNDPVTNEPLDNS